MRINRLAFVLMALAMLAVYTLLPDVAGAKSPPGARAEVKQIVFEDGAAVSAPAATAAATSTHEYAPGASEVERPPGARAVALMTARHVRTLPCGRVATNERDPPPGAVSIVGRQGSGVPSMPAGVALSLRV